MTNVKGGIMKAVQMSQFVVKQKAFGSVIIAHLSNSFNAKICVVCRKSFYVNKMNNNDRSIIFTCTLFRIKFKMHL